MSSNFSYDLPFRLHDSGSQSRTTLEAEGDPYLHHQTVTPEKDDDPSLVPRPEDRKPLARFTQQEHSQPVPPAVPEVPREKLLRARAPYWLKDDIPPLSEVPSLKPSTESRPRSIVKTSTTEGPNGTEYIKAMREVREDTNQSPKNTSTSSGLCFVA